MSIGETILDMHPQEWLSQQQQLSALFIVDQQNCHYIPDEQMYLNNNAAIYEQQKFLNDFILMNQLENLSQQQYGNRHQRQYQNSRSMTADTFLKDFAQLQQKLGLMRPAKPQNHSGSVSQIMSHFQSTGYNSQQNNSTSNNQLTESVAEFFRKAQQNFRPNVAPEGPAKVRRLSDVEAEMILSRYTKGSSWATFRERILG